MYLAKVISPVVCTVKHKSLEGKRLFLIQPMAGHGTEYEIAIDYVGAGPGDRVLAGGPPGAAKSIFGLERAPFKTLIMGVVE